MNTAGEYRHELKYQIDYIQFLELRQRLKTVMRPDIHTDAAGHYLIRSVYFDNLNDKVLREKTDGVQRREKFRIRYYNDDLNFIKLEKKIKYNNLCMKLYAEITQEQCRSILSGENCQWMLEHPSGIIGELYCKMKTQQLRPRVTVSYVREPYVYPAGNVRVTFDSYVRTSLYCMEFMETEVHDISAMDNPEDIILEIKYDAFLPEIISHMIQTEGIRQSAFSKYAACRRFG